MNVTLELTNALSASVSHLHAHVPNGHPIRRRITSVGRREGTVSRVLKGTSSPETTMVGRLQRLTLTASKYRRRCVQPCHLYGQARHTGPTASYLRAYKNKDALDHRLYIGHDSHFLSRRHAFPHLRLYA